MDASVSTRGRSWVSGGVGFLWSRKLELCVLALGVGLRVSMRYSYLPAWSYDADPHWAMVEWIAKYHRTPPADAMLQAQHPPLYYALAAWLWQHGVSREQMVWVSILFGSVRLCLIWAACELYLVGQRWTRVATLALGAVLPASIHLDGMIYPEALSGAWICAALLLVPRAFGRRGAARYPATLGIGVILGLSMLTKISAVVVIGALGVTVLLELLLSNAGLRARVWSALPWAAMLAVTCTICGWYFMRNWRDYGRPFVTTFDLKTEHVWVKAYDGVPIVDRRSLGFFVGFSRSIYAWPFWPAAMAPHPRFFPVALASTFVDYWNFSFSGIPLTEPSPIAVGTRPMTPQVLAAARYSVAGGTVIALASAAAWVVALKRSLARKDFGAVGVLAVPLFTLLAALQFAATYPVDHYGVVKGVYMQFGAAPMYLLFGLAVDWARQRVSRWPILAFLLAALWCVATYAVYCRFRIRLLPLG